MPISEDDVRRLAHLARIAISDQDVAETGAQLNGILEMIGQMRAVDTSGIEPMSHGIDVVQRLRADQVTESDHREAFQAIAPQVENGLYLVPKVIE